MNKNYITDEELMSKFCKTLDEDVFKELMARYYSKALSIARKRIWNHSNAEDVVQEAFIKVVKNRDKFNTNLKFYNWFYKIIDNISIEHLRKELRNRDKIKEISIFLNKSDNISKYNLDEHLSKIKEEDKNILISHYVDGFTFKEISKKLDIPVETLKKRAQRAIKKIQKNIK